MNLAVLYLALVSMLIGATVTWIISTFQHDDEKLTAESARQEYASDAYKAGLRACEDAINRDAPVQRWTCVDVPTGRLPFGECDSYYVALVLRKQGFDVTMQHDPENGSTELTIKW